MYLGQFQKKNLFQNKFFVLFCPPLKYFRSLGEQIHVVRKLILIFSHPLKIFQNSSAVNKV
jgi:hypothetical protein